MVGRPVRMPRYLDGGAAYGRDHEFHTHDGGRESYRHRLQILHGAWDEGEAGMRAILGGAEVTGLARHALPTLARLAVRRGRDDAEHPARVGARHAERADDCSRRCRPRCRARARLAGGRPGSAERRRRRSCCPAPSGSALSAPGRAAALPAAARCSTPSRSPGARRSSRPGCAVTGGRRPRPGSGSATLRAGAGARRVRPAEPTLEALAVFDGLGAAARRRLVRRGCAPSGSHGCPAARSPPRAQPGRAHRPAGGDPPAARRGPDQRRDRGAPGGLGAHGRPPRLGRAAEARRDRRQAAAAAARSRMGASDVL